MNATPLFRVSTESLRERLEVQDAYANWSPYAGSGSIILAVVLLIGAGLLIYLALRLPHPIAVKRPGAVVGALIVVIWLLSVVTFLVALTVYVSALYQQVGQISGPADPITRVTMASGLFAFFAIIFLTQRSGFWFAPGSAIVGTIAAPTIFELPFDLIVMRCAFPPNPAALYTPLFFLPLFVFVVEISSFALLTLSPVMMLSRSTLILLAGMFLVFAVWALFGFPYPSAPLPTALNMLSKVLAFAAAISLFLPEGSPAYVTSFFRGGAATAARAPETAGLM